MSVEQNKAVVRQFIMEALTGRNLHIADDLLSPKYKNQITGADITAFKGMLYGMSKALSGIQFKILELVAEGDSVVVRWEMKASHVGSLMGETPSGKEISSRGMTYYRLLNGQIVEDDPVSSPDLLQTLGIQIPY